HEARVARLAGEPVERLHHLVAVVGTDGPDPHAPPIAERGLDRLEYHGFCHDPSPAAAPRAPPPLHPAPPVPAASRAVRPPARDGANSESLLAAVETLRCPVQQRLVMDIPGQGVMAFAVGGDLPRVLSVPDAAMQRRLKPRQMPASLHARL